MSLATTSKKILKFIIKAGLWSAVGLTGLSLILSALLMIPDIQLAATQHLGRLLSEKSDTDLRLESIHLLFPYTLKLEGLLAQDAQQDTLIYCGELQLSANMLPLIHKKIEIKSLKIHGIKGHLVQNEDDTTNNFSPILSAFAGGEKSTTKASWQIEFEEIALRDAHIHYESRADSTDMLLSLGLLTLDAHRANVTEKSYDLRQISLKHTHLSMRLPPKQKAGSPPLPSSSTIPIDLSLTALQLEDISWQMLYADSSLAIATTLQQAMIQPDAIDLHDQNLKLAKAEITDFHYRMILRSDATKYTLKDSLPTAPAFDYAFGNTDWQLTTQRLRIHNSSCQLELNSSTPDSEKFDYSHLHLQNINLSADSIFFNRQAAGAIVNQLKMADRSGAEINRLSGKFIMDNDHIMASQLMLTTNKSMLRGNINLSYHGVSSFSADAGSISLAADLSGKICPADLRPYSKFMEKQAFLSKFNTVNIQSFSLRGPLRKLHIQQLSLATLHDTHLTLQATLHGLTTEKPSLSYQLDTLVTSQRDIALFLSDSLEQQLQLPNKISLKSMGETGPHSMSGSLSLAADQTQIKAKATLDNSQWQADIQISADVHQFLPKSVFGQATLSANFTSKNVEKPWTDFTLQSKLMNVTLLDHAYHHGTVLVRRLADRYTVKLQMQDTALTLLAKLQLADTASEHHANLHLTVDHANFQEMNISKFPFLIQGNIHTDVVYANATNIEIDLVADHWKMSKETGYFLLDQVNLTADIKPTYNNFHLTSPVIDAYLTGNTRIAEIPTAFMDQLDHYVKMPDSLLSDKKFNFEFDIVMKNETFFTDFLVDGLNEFQLEQCHVSYNDAADQLNATVLIPALDYKQILLKDFQLQLNSDIDNADLHIDAASVSAGTINFNKVSYRSKIFPAHIQSEFRIHDNYDSLWQQIATSLDYSDSNYLVHINPDRLIINYQKWEVPEDNSFQIHHGNILSSHCNISYQDQRISLQATNRDLKVGMKNFDLRSVGTFAGINDLRGHLSGALQVMNIWDPNDIRFRADIPDLGWQQQPIGQLAISLQHSKASPASFEVKLHGPENYVFLSGTTSGSRPQMIGEINIGDASVFEPLISSHMKNLNGSIHGRISMTGQAQPELNGRLTMEKLAFSTIQTGSYLRMDGSVLIQNNKLFFQQLSLADSLGNKAKIEGDIDGNPWQNPAFDISLSAPHFLAINSTKNTAHILSGSLDLGIDAQVKGRLSSLQVRSKININPTTDIMYTMPGKELELISDEGVVQFTDQQDLPPKESLPEGRLFIADSIMASVGMTDLLTTLTIDPDAKFTVYVDPNAGDYAQFSVQGNMQYSYNNRQRGQLNGLVELRNGLYQLSFYGLVKKEFSFDPGSTVTWSGVATDGLVKFSARHTVRTNSVGLVSNEISSYERSMYNQRLPYDVVLYVRNKLDNPEVSFGIDLPEKYRTDYPTLDAKLNQLNQPGMASERNKQVFALLVGGTFIPENPNVSEGSANANFATTAARNSVNAIMTQQLNKLTGQIIKGIDIDMGVNTYDDYATGRANTRTQLDVKVSKNLFNDRVSAEMESHINLDGSVEQVGGQSSAGLTEFAVSYKLNEKGNYRIKAFRENAYDIFDGEIQNSGLAFIIIREFNRPKKHSKPMNNSVSDRKQKHKTDTIHE